MATPEAIAEKAPAKKTTKLKAVDPKAAEPSKPKILVFGKPGVGKTWASLDFPSVYYIDTEGGADLDHYTDKLKKSGGAYFGPEQGSLDFASIIEQVQALATEKHEYRTLVIDSISKIFALEIAKEADRLGEKNGFGADKKAAIAYMRKLVSWLTRLDMNVVMIAHEKPLWGVDAKGERSEIGVTFDAWDKLEYELHLCLNIFKQGKDHKARVTKTRLTGFPTAEVFTWSYSDFATRYGKDVIEQNAKQIVLASAEQLAKLKSLLDIVKLPENQIEKWFKAAGDIEKWEDMDSTKAQAIIDYIIKTYVNQGETK